MTEHSIYRERMAGYALGALEGTELAELEAHLESCAECRRELRELREVLVRLAEAISSPGPRPELRARVLERARAARHDVTPLPQPGQRDLDGDAPARAPAVPTSRGGAFGWLAAAAMAAIAILAGWGYLRAEDARVDAETRAGELVAELEAERQRAVRAEGIVDDLLAPDVATATLSATAQPPSMRLFWNRERNVVVVATFDMAAPPEGRTYQLWGIDTAAGTAPVGLGTFEPGSDGRTVTTFAVPVGLTFDLAAVTEEPDGGSPAPTTTPFLAGPITAD